MKISNHIHYIDQSSQCLRYDIGVAEPLHLGALLGDDDRATTLESIYPADAIPSPQVAPSIVSAAGIFHVVELMPMESVLSVALRPGYALKDLVVRSGDDVTVLASQARLVFWVASGQAGILLTRPLNLLGGILSTGVPEVGHDVLGQG